MKTFLVLALAAGAVGCALAQPVNLSIGINQPGVYGQINIGNLPPPALVAPRPVIIVPGRVAGPPIYLYVPVSEQQHWRRHCHRYNACGRHVYFVRDQWVRERYAHEHPGWDHGRGRGRDGHDGRRDGHRDHRGDRGDHDRRI